VILERIIRFVKYPFGAKENAAEKQVGLGEIYHDKTD
jgi:hypothetical protein